MDPSGLPLGERTPSGTLYYLYNGHGDVVMAVDPPNGAPVAIVSDCPTGNQNPESWQAPGTTARDHLIHKSAAASGNIADAGTKDTL